MFFDRIGRIWALEWIVTIERPAVEEAEVDNKKWYFVV